VPRVGPGRNHLSCVYAGNVAAAVVAALDGARPGFRAYNVTHDAPPDLSEREWIAAFATALGVRVWRLPVPAALARLGAVLWTRWRSWRRPGRYAGLGRAAVAFLTGENPYTTARIREGLGWTPPLDARTAIARTVRWYANADAPEPSARARGMQ